MKIEQREVTITKEVYIAEDGREFDDEDECVEYEIDLAESSLKTYNREYEEVSLDECVFVNLITKKDVETFKIACGYYGITSEGVTEPALYMYCDYLMEDCWVNLDDVMFRIRGGLTNDQT